MPDETASSFTNRQHEMLSLKPGKYTLVLRGRCPFGKALSRTVRVTVLGSAKQHGWSSNGTWFLSKPSELDTTPHCVLPVRMYRHRIETAFWIGFIVDIKKDWAS